MGSRVQKVTSELKKVANTTYGYMLINFFIITLIAVIIFRNWLFTTEWPAGGDILGWISRSYIYGKDLRWTHLWRPYSFGFVEGINSMDFFLAATYQLCGDAATTIKIFTFSMFLVAGFSMYVFVYRYCNRHLAALSASLFYILNQWFFTQLTEGHVDIIFSYALFPIIFLLVERILSTNGAKNILLATLALSLLVTGFHPEFVVIYGVFLIFFFIFHVLALMYAQRKDFSLNIKILLRKFAFIVILFFLISSFWLIPFLLGIRAPYFSSAYQYPIEDAMEISYPNIIDAFILRAWEVWGYVVVIDLRNDMGAPFFPVYTLLLVVSSICILTALLRRDKYTIFSLFSIFVSVIVATGPNSPFGSIFIWAWFNIPHFAVFRAANRWIAIAAFCYAFLISVFVSLSESYIKKARTIKFHEVYLKSKALLVDKKEILDFYISVEFLNKVINNMRRFLYYLIHLLLILIFINGFLSCYYFFSHGLQVYTPPQTHLEPYTWIADKSGDYKVVTASKSPSEWMKLSYQESDFAHVGMLTTIGWTHDIGYDSSFIHEKPTLQNGGWTFEARDFVDYLRFYLARQSLTKDMAEMLGIFGYKYFVLPTYASENIKNFFSNQKGLKAVFTNNSIVLENDFFTQRIFATNQYVMVIGGLEAFSSLLTIDNVELNKTALIFADQISGLSTNTVLINSKAILFVNSDIVDLIMLHLKEEAIFEYAAAYAAPSLNFTKYWVSWPAWRITGGFALGRNTATTLGSNAISIPFQLSSAGTYDIWIRVGFSSARGELSIYVDDLNVGKLYPSSSFWSRLMWINITRLELTGGTHTLTLINDGTGYNDVDAVAVVKTSLFRQKSEEISNTLNRYKGRIVYLLHAESIFDYVEGCFASAFPFEGYVFRLESSTHEQLSSSAHFFVPKQGRYMIGLRLACGPDYGKLDVNIMGHQFTFNCLSSNLEFKWFEFGPLTMEPGDKSMIVSVDGKVDIDEIIIYSLKDLENSLSIDNLFNYDTDCVQPLTYERENSDRYIIHVNSTAPFLLIFSDAYHPLWKAYVDESEISPIVAYSFVNGFFINKTGQFDIILYFTGQAYADIGLKISAISLIITLAILVTPSKALKKIEKLLKNGKSRILSHLKTSEYWK